MDFFTASPPHSRLAIDVCIDGPFLVDSWVFYGNPECWLKKQKDAWTSGLMFGKGEFEELEVVPTSAVIEGPLELGLTNSRSTDVPEDSSFVNFFSTAMNLVHNPSNPVNYIPPYPTPIPLPSRDTPSPVPNNPPLQNPSCVPTIPLHDNSDQVNTTNHVTNLIKPLSFFTHTSSSSAPPPLMRQPSSTLPVTTLQPPLNVQRNIGFPLLQPFPPPPSLNPTSNSAPFHGPLTREKVRHTLVMLSQDNQFIDMFYQASLKLRLA
ncbi:hypothetical protein L2E82_04307 [Cichorium intybus]|uniref:Uncharacterized protein n=1 Tax=Cichorium intybus TaxID=13427 RepID=A0ACB9H6V0_CICIN|nr:hypothetical protein L2E82_04307 [Cichorium intybus]